MVKLPFTPQSEINRSPSLLTLANPDEGVLSRLNHEQKDPNFNGKTLDNLRDESPLNRLGKIEQLAVAEKTVEENMKVYKKSAFGTAFAKAVQSAKSLKSKK